MEWEEAPRTNSEEAAEVQNREVYLAIPTTSPPQEMGTHYLPKKSTTFWAALTDVKLYLLLR